MATAKNERFPKGGMYKNIYDDFCHSFLNEEERAALKEKTFSALFKAILLPWDFSISKKYPREKLLTNLWSLPLAVVVSLCKTVLLMSAFVLSAVNTSIEHTLNGIRSPLLRFPLRLSVLPLKGAIILYSNAAATLTRIGDVVLGVWQLDRQKIIANSKQLIKHAKKLIIPAGLILLFSYALSGTPPQEVLAKIADFLNGIVSGNVGQMVDSLSSLSSISPMAAITIVSICFTIGLVTAVANYFFPQPQPANNVYQQDGYYVIDDVSPSSEQSKSKNTRGRRQPSVTPEILSEHEDSLPAGSYMTKNGQGVGGYDSDDEERNYASGNDSDCEVKNISDQPKPITSGSSPSGLTSSSAFHSTNHLTKKPSNSQPQHSQEKPTPQQGTDLSHPSGCTLS